MAALFFKGDVCIVGLQLRSMEEKGDTPNDKDLWSLALVGLGNSILGCD